MRRGALALAVAAVLLGGCGGGGKPRLVVFAATSLKPAFERYGASFRGADVRFSFAGSDELAAQVRQGSPADVYAAANTLLPAGLYAQRFVERPVAFASNRLVLAVPAGSRKMASLADASKPGVTVAVGSPSVPVGSYTRRLLARLGPAQSRAILANVRSEEPDVGGIVGKLSQGAVDAGFVYATDVRAARGRLRAIELPARLRPAVRYAAAVVRGTAHARQAQDFVRGLLGGEGRRDLVQAGFR